MTAAIARRIARLEQHQSQASTISGRLQLALERHLAMSPAELAAHEAQHLADCLSALSEPDLQGDEGRFQRARRRLSRHHLESAAP